MQKINLLLVGDATDGPTEDPVFIDDLDVAWRLFGGYGYEYVSITSGSTGYTLSVVPWGDEVTPLQIDSNGQLIPLRLFEFTVSGSILSWTSLGYAVSAVFRYSKIPGPNSLIKGILSARKVGVDFWGVRLGGTQATVQAGAVTFYSRYGGTRYNGITIAITTGGVVTVTPSGGVGRNFIYHVGTDQDLFRILRTETQKGYQGFYVKGAFSNNALTIPAGTYVLSGGTDGAATADKVADFLNTWDTAGIDVICPVGCFTTDLSGQGVFDSLAQNSYPTLLVAQAPLSGIALSGVLVTSRDVVSVAFQIYYDLGQPKQRLDDGAPLVAAIIGNNIFGITLAALPDFPAVPKYDQNSLHILAGSGYTTAYKSISKDWALWQAVTGDPNWPISQYRALQEVARVAYDALEPLIGNILVNEEIIDDQLQEGFAAVTGSRVVDWNLQLEGDILYLDVGFTPHGEIKVVRAQIAIGNQLAISPV